MSAMILMAASSLISMANSRSPASRSTSTKQSVGTLPDQSVPSSVTLRRARAVLVDTTTVDLSAASTHVTLSLITEIKITAAKTHRCNTVCPTRSGNTRTTRRRIRRTSTKRVPKTTASIRIRSQAQTITTNMATTTISTQASRATILPLEMRIIIMMVWRQI